VTARALAMAGILMTAGIGTCIGTWACCPTARAAERSQPVSQPNSFPVASDVRLGGDDKQTRLVIDFDRKVDLAAFTLADPYRVVIDLPQVVFRLSPKAGEQARGLVKAVRYGLIMQGGSRIVLDVKGPVRVEKAFTLPPDDGQPARMVLDLAATDRDSFLRNISLESGARRATATRQTDTAAAPSGDPRPLIVIDPGHGGIDSGTKSYDGKVDEKDVVVGFGIMLRDRLEKSGKYRVEMTRSDDTFIPLNERVRFARSRKASLFISIHADSVPRSEGIATGASVYTLSDKASDAEAASLADAENKSDVIAGVDLSAEPDDVANILIDLAQRETKVFSVQFARTLVNELKPVTKMHAHPIKSAGFIVLKAPDVPSVLVELGYMSTKDDLAHLMSPSWRARAADSLAQAVDTYFAPRLAGAGAAQAAEP